MFLWTHSLTGGDVDAGDVPCIFALGQTDRGWTPPDPGGLSGLRFLQEFWDAVEQMPYKIRARPFDQSAVHTDDS